MHGIQKKFSRRWGGQFLLSITKSNGCFVLWLLLFAIGVFSSALFSVFHIKLFLLYKTCCLGDKASKQLIKMFVCEYKHTYKTVLYGEMYSSHHTEKQGSHEDSWWGDGCEKELKQSVAVEKMGKNIIIEK